MTDEIDDHAGIPRDAKGDPIFLILPPGVQSSYDRRLFACERGWFTTKDPAFVAEALIWAGLHRQPNPPWLTDAAVSLVLGRRTKTHANRAHDDLIHWMRFDTLRTAKEQGLRWLQHRIEDTTKRIAKAREMKAPPAEYIDALKRLLKDTERRAERIFQRGWVTWPDAKQLAVEALQGTGAKTDEPETVRKSYDRVKRDIEAERGALYFLPKLPKKTLSELLQPHD
jgi:hypothetical protein